MIHTTIGLYANGDFKINGVKEEHLEEHIQYNKSFRFGRALFVDGKLVHKGFVSEERIKAFKKRIKKEKLIATECTLPYN